MNKQSTGKIRVLMVELEGDSTTLQQGLRSLAAMAGTMHPMRGLPSPTPVANGDAPTPTGVQEVLVDDEVAATREIHARPARIRKHATPKVLELDLNSGLSLKEFVQKKGPKEESRRYLVILEWLADQRNETVVGADHIYTCYRFLGWNVPSDVGSPLRSLKQQGWVSSNGRGTYSINHIGRNKVNEMGAEDGSS